jgi:hypothetical protein
MEKKKGKKGEDEGEEEGQADGVERKDEKVEKEEKELAVVGADIEQPRPAIFTVQSGRHCPSLFKATSQPELSFKDESARHRFPYFALLRFGHIKP